jgi:predicted Zn finger-like uncharacterized protein
MFTRCPGCSTVHPLNAAMLALGGGEVRCGRCGKRYDATTVLFDAWPDPAAKPAPQDKAKPTPVLGLKLKGEAAKEAAAAPSPAAPRAPRRWPWTAVLAVLLALTAFNVLWTLLGDQFPGRQEAGTFRDADQVRLVSRDLQTHPTRAGVLVLSATIVNEAGRPQPRPDIQVTLLDLSGDPVASRRFIPSEYLPGDPDPGELMEPGAYLPFTLEFADPGETATGFEIEFF